MAVKTFNAAGCAYTGFPVRVDFTLKNGQNTNKIILGKFKPCRL